ncbi:MAG TPA: transporter [Mycobacteriales bacterium]|nr:transporter [Mycobacteriales bacterium]
MTADRVALTVAVVAFGAGMSLLMLRGWRSRQRRQADLPPPPSVPAAAADVVAGPVAGLFVGTTFREDWLDRVAVHGLSSRAPGWLTVRTDGVLLERERVADLWFPHAVLHGARVGDALAGKVVGGGGLLLLDWELGGRDVSSAFRAEDAAEHQRLAAVVSRLTVREAS